jgi:hypothetical protein
VGQAGGNVVAALIALAWLSPGGALAGAVAAGVLPPYLETFARQALTFPAERTARLLEGAAQEADIPVEDLLEGAGADERRAQLTAEAVAAAQATLLEEKIGVLSRSLAEGLQDDAVVETELLLIRTLADVEKPHLQVLQQIAEDRPAGPITEKGWQAADLGQMLPHVAHVLDPVLAVLSRHRLIDDATRGTYDQPHEERWVLTGYGERCLTLLEERGAAG